VQPPLRAAGGQPVQPPPARQYRSTRPTAKSISAHVWGDGVRLSWSTTQFDLQDCPSQQ
jgi:hypothetical protein